MKNIIVLIALVLVAAFTGNSNGMGMNKLRGELVKEGNTIALYTRLGRIELHTTLADVKDCFEGEYVVTDEPKGNAKFKLVKTLGCKGKGKGLSNVEIKLPTLALEKGNFCPMIYSPVCGSVKTEICEAGTCSEKDVTRTYGNVCELKNAGARKLFLGRCEQGVAFGIPSFREIRTSEIYIK